MGVRNDRPPNTVEAPQISPPRQSTDIAAQSQAKPATTAANEKSLASSAQPNKDSYVAPDSILEPKRATELGELGPVPTELISSDSLAAELQRVDTQTLAEAFQHQDPKIKNAAFAEYRFRQAQLNATIQSSGLGPQDIPPKSEAGLALAELSELENGVRPQAAQWMFSRSRESSAELEVLSRYLAGDTTFDAQKILTDAGLKNPKRLARRLRSRAGIMKRHHINSEVLAEISLRSFESPVDFSSYGKPLSRHFRVLQQRGNSANAAMFIELAHTVEQGRRLRAADDQSVLNYYTQAIGSGNTSPLLAQQAQRIEADIRQSTAEAESLHRWGKKIAHTAKQRREAYPQELAALAASQRAGGDDEAANLSLARAQSAQGRRVAELEKQRNKAEIAGKLKKADRLAGREARARVGSAAIDMLVAQPQIDQIDRKSRIAVKETKAGASPVHIESSKDPVALSDANQQLERAVGLDDTVREEPEFWSTAGQVRRGQASMAASRVSALGRGDLAYASMSVRPHTGLLPSAPGMQQNDGANLPELDPKLQLELQDLQIRRAQAESSFSAQASIYEQRAGAGSSDTPKDIAQKLSALPADDRAQYREALRSRDNMREERTVLSSTMLASFQVRRAFNQQLKQRHQELASAVQTYEAANARYEQLINEDSSNPDDPQRVLAFETQREAQRNMVRLGVSVGFAASDARIAAHMRIAAGLNVDPADDRIEVGYSAAHAVASMRQRRWKTPLSARATALQESIENRSESFASIVRATEGTKAPSGTPPIGLALIDRDDAVLEAMWEATPPTSDQERYERISEGSRSVAYHRRAGFFTDPNANGDHVLRPERAIRAQATVNAMNLSVDTLPLKAQPQARFFSRQAELQTFALHGVQKAEHAIVRSEEIFSEVHDFGPQIEGQGIQAPKGHHISELNSEIGVSQIIVHDELAAAPTLGQTDTLFDSTLISRSRHLVEESQELLPHQSTSFKYLKNTTERWEQEYQNAIKLAEQQVRALMLHQGASVAEVDTLLAQRAALVEGQIGSILQVALLGQKGRWMDEVQAANKEQSSHAHKDISKSIDHQTQSLLSVYGIMQNRDLFEQFLSIQRAHQTFEFTTTSGDTATVPGWAESRAAHAATSLGIESGTKIEDLDTAKQELLSEAFEQGNIDGSVFEQNMLFKAMLSRRAMGVSQTWLDAGLPHEGFRPWVGANTKNPVVMGMWGGRAIDSAEAFHLEMQREFLDDEMSAAQWRTPVVQLGDAVAWAIVGNWAASGAAMGAGALRGYLAGKNLYRAGQVSAWVARTAEGSGFIARNADYGMRGYQWTRAARTTLTTAAESSALLRTAIRGQRFFFRGAEAASGFVAAQYVMRNAPPEYRYTAEALANFMIFPSQLSAAGLVGGAESLAIRRGMALSEQVRLFSQTHGMGIGMSLLQVGQDQYLLPELISDPILRERVSLVLNSFIAAGVGHVMDGRAARARAEQQSYRIVPTETGTPKNVRDQQRAQVQALLERRYTTLGPEFGHLNSAQIEQQSSAMYGQLKELGIETGSAREASLDLYRDWAQQRNSDLDFRVMSDEQAAHVIQERRMRLEDELNTQDNTSEFSLSAKEQQSIVEGTTMSMALPHMSRRPDIPESPEFWLVRQQEVQNALVERLAMSVDEASTLAVAHIYGELSSLRAERPQSEHAELDRAQAEIHQQQLILGAARTLLSPDSAKPSSALLAALSDLMAPELPTQKINEAWASLEQILAETPNLSMQGIDALRLNFDRALATQALEGHLVIAVDPASPPNRDMVADAIQNTITALKKAGVSEKNVRSIAESVILHELTQPLSNSNISPSDRNRLRAAIFGMLDASQARPQKGSDPKPPTSDPKTQTDPNSAPASEPTPELFELVKDFNELARAEQSRLLAEVVRDGIAPVRARYERQTQREQAHAISPEVYGRDIDGMHFSRGQLADRPTPGSERPLRGLDIIDFQAFHQRNPELSVADAQKLYRQGRDMNFDPVTGAALGTASVRIPQPDGSTQTITRRFAEAQAIIQRVQNGEQGAAATLELQNLAGANSAFGSEAGASRTDALNTFAELSKRIAALPDSPKQREIQEALSVFQDSFQNPIDDSSVSRMAEAASTLRAHRDLLGPETLSSVQTMESHFSSESANKILRVYEGMVSAALDTAFPDHSIIVLRDNAGRLSVFVSGTEVSQTQLSSALESVEQGFLEWTKNTTWLQLMPNGQAPQPTLVAELPHPTNPLIRGLNIEYSAQEVRPSDTPAWLLALAGEGLNRTVDHHYFEARSTEEASHAHYLLSQNVLDMPQGRARGQASEALKALENLRQKSADEVLSEAEVNDAKAAIAVLRQGRDGFGGLEMDPHLRTLESFFVDPLGREVANAAVDMPEIQWAELQPHTSPDPITLLDGAEPYVDGIALRRERWIQNYIDGVAGDAKLSSPERKEVRVRAEAEFKLSGEPNVDPRTGGDAGTFRGAQLMTALEHGAERGALVFSTELDQQAMGAGNTQLSREGANLVFARNRLIVAQALRAEGFILGGEGLHGGDEGYIVALSQDATLSDGSPVSPKMWRERYFRALRAAESEIQRSTHASNVEGRDFNLGTMPHTKPGREPGMGMVVAGLEVVPPADGRIPSARRAVFDAFERTALAIEVRKKERDAPIDAGAERYVLEASDVAEGTESKGPPPAAKAALRDGAHDTEAIELGTSWAPVVENGKFETNARGDIVLIRGEETRLIGVSEFLLRWMQQAKGSAVKWEGKAYRLTWDKNQVVLEPVSPSQAKARLFLKSPAKILQLLNENPSSWRTEIPSLTTLGLSAGFHGSDLQVLRYLESQRSNLEAQGVRFPIFEAKRYEVISILIQQGVPPRDALVISKDAAAYLKEHLQEFRSHVFYANPEKTKAEYESTQAKVEAGAKAKDLPFAPKVHDSILQSDVQKHWDAFRGIVDPQIAENVARGVSTHLPNSEWAKIRAELLEPGSSLRDLANPSPVQMLQRDLLAQHDPSELAQSGHAFLRARRRGYFAFQASKELRLWLKNPAQPPLSVRRLLKEVGHYFNDNQAITPTPDLIRAWYQSRWDDSVESQNFDSGIGPKPEKLPYFLEGSPPLHRRFDQLQPGQSVYPLIQSLENTHFRVYSGVIDPSSTAAGYAGTSARRMNGSDLHVVPKQERDSSKTRSSKEGRDFTEEASTVIHEWDHIGRDFSYQHASSAENIAHNLLGESIAPFHEFLIYNRDFLATVLTSKDSLKDWLGQKLEAYSEPSLVGPEYFPNNAMGREAVDLVASQLWAIANGGPGHQSKNIETRLENLSLILRDPHGAGMLGSLTPQAIKALNTTFDRHIQQNLREVGVNDARMAELVIHYGWDAQTANAYADLALRGFGEGLQGLWPTEIVALQKRVHGEVPSSHQHLRFSSEQLLVLLQNPGLFQHLSEQSLPLLAQYSVEHIEGLNALLEAITSPDQHLGQWLLERPELLQASLAASEHSLHATRVAIEQRDTTMLLALQEVAQLGPETFKAFADFHGSESAMARSLRHAPAPNLHLAHHLASGAKGFPLPPPDMPVTVFGPDGLPSSAWRVAQVRGSRVTLKHKDNGKLFSVTLNEILASHAIALRSDWQRVRLDGQSWVATTGESGDIVLIGAERRNSQQRRTLKNRDEFQALIAENPKLIPQDVSVAAVYRIDDRIRALGTSRMHDFEETHAEAGATLLDAMRQNLGDDVVLEIFARDSSSATLMRHRQVLEGPGLRELMDAPESIRADMAIHRLEDARRLDGHRAVVDEGKLVVDEQARLLVEGPEGSRRTMAPSDFLKMRLSHIEGQAILRYEGESYQVLVDPNMGVLLVPDGSARGPDQHLNGVRRLSTPSAIIDLIHSNADILATAVPSDHGIVIKRDNEHDSNAAAIMPEVLPVETDTRDKGGHLEVVPDRHNPSPPEDGHMHIEGEFHYHQGELPTGLVGASVEVGPVASEAGSSPQAILHAVGHVDSAQDVIQRDNQKFTRIIRNAAERLAITHTDIAFAEQAALRGELSKQGMEHWEALQQALDQITRITTRFEDLPRPALQNPEGIERAQRAQRNYASRISSYRAQLNRLVNSIEILACDIRADTAGIKSQQLSPDGIARFSQNPLQAIENVQSEHLQNVAYAELHIDGQQSLALPPAVSGSLNRAGDGSLADEARTLRNMGNWPRHNDTEVQLLEQVAAQLKNNPDAAGTIRLYTRLEPCPSCMRVMSVFLQNHPNIRLEVFHGNSEKTGETS